MQTRTESGQRGFSLIELMIAMVVTLIVTGAMYGLLASGNSAFKREPALTDRQQNIRTAMNLIQRDLQNAGSQMPPFVQVFLPGQDDLGPAVPGGGPDSDFLQFVGSTGECPALSAPTVAGQNVNVMEVIPPCYNFPAAGGPTGALIMIATSVPGTTPIGRGEWSGSAAAPTLSFAGAQPAGIPQCLGAPPCPPANPISILPLEVYRYEIAPDPIDQMPSLWRSTTGGGLTSLGAYTPANAVPNTAGEWQLVARGIEDMQVGYRMFGAAPNAFATGPLAVVGVPPTYPTLVQEVQVMLQARSDRRLGAAGVDMTGTTQEASAFRGRLTSRITPRAVLGHLSVAVPPLYF